MNRDDLLAQLDLTWFPPSGAKEKSRKQWKLMPRYGGRVLAMITYAGSPIQQTFFLGQREPEPQARKESFEHAQARLFERARLYLLGEPHEHIDDDDEEDLCVGTSR